MDSHAENEFLQGKALEREAIYLFCRDFIVLEDDKKPWIERFDNQTHHLFLMLGKDIPENIKSILTKIEDKIKEVKEHREKYKDDATPMERFELTSLVESIAPYYEN